MWLSVCCSHRRRRIPGKIVVWICPSHPPARPEPAQTEQSRSFAHTHRRNAGHQPLRPSLWLRTRLRRRLRAPPSIRTAGARTFCGRASLCDQHHCRRLHHHRQRTRRAHARRPARLTSFIARDGDRRRSSPLFDFVRVPDTRPHPGLRRADGAAAAGRGAAAHGGGRRTLQARLDSAG